MASPVSLLTVAARAFRDELLSKLPEPTTIKRNYVRNAIGVIGVANQMTLRLCLRVRTS